MTTQSRSRASGGPKLAAISALAILAVAVIAVIAVQVLSGDDGANDPSPPPDMAGTTLSAQCAEVHAGHNTMSWNPTMADEMIECGWPYDPFATTLEGGEEDPGLDDAPFEPHLYADLWTMLGETDLGVCAVPNLPDEAADGFTFGFSYGLAEPGCPDAAPTTEMIVREYSTRPQRDAAAHRAAEAEGQPPVYVLGRWVITLHGDEGGVGQVSSALTAIDAAPVER